ncbi:MAG: vacuolar-sorting protein SNF7 [Amphiamblys sp. WSBS2006]|nr:MAG: vacuolar-sorting protein SNF7 [Amphiamblys sp. WSBS2006]
MNLFGLGKKKKDKKPQDTEKKDTVALIGENIALLEKKEKYIEKKIEAEVETAKKNAQKNKAAAMSALRRKQMLEKQHADILNQKTTLETQLFAIENAKINRITFLSMQEAKHALGALTKDVSIENVDDLTMDLQEHTIAVSELSEALAAPIGTTALIDEDDLLRELEDIQQEEIQKVFTKEREQVKETPETDEDSDTELRELHERMGL